MTFKQIGCVAAGLLLVAGCAPPSAEQIATMTAAAWTPTPVPSPTPTPIPYSLTVHIADESGAGIPARVAMIESGTEAPVQTDASGVYTWPSLSGPNGSLQVSAPGYYSASQPVTMEPGSNELAVVLQRDPLGLSPEDACAPSETPLFAEDFQSGKADGLRTTVGAPGASSVVTQDDGNRVLSIGGIGLTQVEYPTLLIDNAVVRLRVQASGRDGDSFVNLRHLLAGGDTRYIFQWGANPFLSLRRFDGGAGSEAPLSVSQFLAKPGKWHYLELSYYNGALQAWADGKKQIDVTDPVPLPMGTFGFEIHVQADPKQTYLFDNISVCELSAPFSTSLYKAPVQ